VSARSAPDRERDRLVVAITGASGALYALRLLRAVLASGLDVDLVVSAYGKRLLIEECGLNVKTESIEQRLRSDEPDLQLSGSITLHGEQELGAPIASGSRRWRGMVVVPCSMKTLSGIAQGSASNLVERAADVTLKERRPLVLVPRETPLNLIHLENMVRASRAGAAIVPAMPAFYFGPRTFDDLADFVAGRVLALLGLEHALFKPWDG
jgi:4-hydroxy-3-polyprenylbenzoate decarboxylase